ncbi:cation diffusion facilitator family transporter [Brachybacterium kimchii]|uniref:Cation diffusion facilitator family transporter n=1 Tax=Brachybacterium kimchii TaxID=2942909 RepID=A0ABY4NBZ9_9MICO|nr:cation diffusion facilitator family transporter [Brachybacterium kimchii]UQN31357.1 cation diffusion facilitator family transporter [Brachybacterium kimchii]
MGADEHGGSHGAAHSHSHASAAQALSAGGKHRRRLAWALVLIGGFFVVELVTALLTGSLALLSDAGHMAADVLTLAAALGATVLAARPDRTGRRSFGSYRLEVFASLLAVLVMLGVSVFVVLEAIGRIGAGADGAHVDSVPMLVVGALGLVVNLAVMRLLRAGAQESLNVKGAYLEVLADTIGSVGVVAAAILVGATGSTLWDTAIALAIGVFVALRALILGREVLSVLGQETPRHLDPGSVGEDLRAVPGVTDVHDLHLWTVTSGMDVLTVHLRVREGADGHAVLDAAESMLRERHGLDHCTLQIEPEDHRTDQETTW